MKGLQAAMAELRANAARGRVRAVSFFGVTFPYPARDAIDWARDYKSGRRAPARFYADLDYRDEAQVGDSKYTWELNRHQFLLPWALEFSRGRNEASAAAVMSVILDWIAQNPRYVGVNWISSLEHALRILNWGICFDLCRKSDAAEKALPYVSRSVAEKSRFIRETLSQHSSANNHLMGELAGLLAAGAFFPGSDGAADHAAFARDAIAREGERQNHADGVNREQAIYYHHYTAEYLLTADSLLRRMKSSLSVALQERTRRMLTFIDAMTDDSGQPFEIGDRDDGSVTGLNIGTGVSVFESLLWTAAARFGDAEAGAHAARIARHAGRSPEADARTRYWYPSAAIPMTADVPTSRRWFFPDGGYFIAEDDGWTLLFKAGPFGYPSIAAHSHCDQLGVLLRTGGQDVLTDGGTCVYHTEERWRRYFKGTAAHNTVRVDGVDQAEYAGTFLWGSHANGRLGVPTGGAAGFEILGYHEGYRRLVDPVSHERRVAFRSGAGYRISDALDGSRAHQFELFWNVGSGFDAVPAEDLSRDVAAAWSIIGPREAVCRLVVIAQGEVVAEQFRGDESRPAGFESRRYLERTPCVQFRVTARGPSFRCVTYILPGAGGAGENSESLERRWVE